MPTKKRIATGRGIQLARQSNDVTVDRLEELRAEMGHKRPGKPEPYNYSEFADFLGVGRPRYNTWRNDGATMRADALKQLAEKCRVTADWLLGIEGAPKYSNQWRADATLESDLAAHVAREAVAVARPVLPPGIVQTIRAKDNLLQLLAAMAAEDVRARAPYYRGVREDLNARATLGLASMVLKRGGRAELASEVNGALAVLARRLDARPPAGKVITWQQVNSAPALDKPAPARRPKRGRAK